MKIRAFIAIELPSEIKQALADEIAQLSPQVPNGSVRWVKAEQMHLTLRFLGDTEVALLAKIKKGMDEAAAAHPPFTLHLNHLGCFPNPRRPRAIWAGVAGDLQPLQALKKGLDDQLAPLGWEPEDRPFNPHLTLGRVKHSHHRIQLPWNQPLAAQPFTITAIHLIQSDLRPTGPIYTTQHTTELGL